VIGAAVKVAGIATGETKEYQTKPSGKVLSGRAGTYARESKLTKEQRSEIARMAAHARWVK
jgi:hypothetical protein